jgi:hypothetical protein
MNCRPRKPGTAGLKTGLPSFVTSVSNQNADENGTYDSDELSVAIETSAPIPRFPPGPWRSLGECFDYSHWPDRDRFLELDGALASAQFPEPQDKLPHELSKWIEDERLQA